MPAWRQLSKEARNRHAKTGSSVDNLDEHALGSDGQVAQKSTPKEPEGDRKGETAKVFTHDVNQRALQRMRVEEQRLPARQRTRVSTWTAVNCSELRNVCGCSRDTRQIDMLGPTARCGQLHRHGQPQ